MGGHGLAVDCVPTYLLLVGVVSVLTPEYIFVSDGDACWGGLWNICGLNQSISSDWVSSFRKRSPSVVPLTLVTDWS